MNRLDRIVIRALINRNVKFDHLVPSRFACIGEARFYKPLPSERWSLLFGHDAPDHGLPLGWIAHQFMEVASRYAVREKQSREEPARHHHDGTPDGLIDKEDR